MDGWSDGRTDGRTDILRPWFFPERVPSLVLDIVYTQTRLLSGQVQFSVWNNPLSWFDNTLVVTCT